MHIAVDRRNICVLGSQLSKPPYGANIRTTVMNYTFKFTHTELGALLDALKKGASRHESYAKFYPGQKEEQHRAMAVTQRHMLARIERDSKVAR